MTAQPAEHIFLLFGEDRPGMQAFFKALCQDVLGTSTPDAFNLIQLDARQDDEERLYTECMTLPFWGGRRLVLYRDPLVRLKSKGAMERFITFLEALPPSTVLVLWVNDHWIPSGKGKGWEQMGALGRDLLAWARGASSRVAVHEFPLPVPAKMPTWIMKHAQDLGGSFAPDAAQVLASLVGNDTQQAHQEIQKLLTYVNFERPVSADDVLQLTAAISQANVYEMTEALASGNTSRALRLLEILLEEQDAIGLLMLIVREFRLLLLVREFLDKGINQSGLMADSLRIPDFAVENLVRRARRYSLAQLENIYHRLFETDLAIKTGQSEPRVALEQMIVSLALP